MQCVCVCDCRLVRSCLERRKRLIVLLLVAFVGGIIFLSCFCPSSVCTTVSHTPASRPHPLPSTQRPSPTVAPEVDLSPVPEFSDEDLWRTFSLDAERDVLVFLHAQKTGGSTFGRHLVRNTVSGVPAPCVCYRRRKRCDCADDRGRQWLFSRYSMGWVCGLHADWTELHDCVPQYLDKREGQRRQRRCVFDPPLRCVVLRLVMREYCFSFRIEFYKILQKLKPDKFFVRNTSQNYGVTCHIGSHNVTCHPTQASTPRLNPSQ